MHIHLKFQGHSDNSSAIFELLHKLLADILALLSLLKGRILSLLLLRDSFVD
jgi:hypothetical protein